MLCPICQDMQHVEIDLRGGRLACGVIKECRRCGAVWSKTEQEISMISVPKKTYVAETIMR